MDAGKIIEQIRQNDPKSIGEVPDSVAKRLLLACFAEIRASVEACEEGRVPVKGLGVFIIRQAPATDKVGARRVVRFNPIKGAAKNKA